MKIETFVFMDIETTGLPDRELNKTRITELSMVALKRNHILDATVDNLPRVVHKLTMCFNPGKYIDPVSTEITGMCNFLLEYESPFNIDVFKTIDSFLNVLKEPICFVAHNGNRFDFPILKNHLEKLNVRFSKNIFCADSFYGIYNIEAGCELLLSPSTDSIKDGYKISDVSQIPYEGILKKNTGETVITESSKNDTVCDGFDKIERGKDSNDLTTLKNAAAYQKTMQIVNNSTPNNRKRRMNIDYGSKSAGKARRKLPWGDNLKPDKSYRLEDIYKRLVRPIPPVSHRAEDDCIMLMHISVALNNKFVQWVDNNCCLFSDIEAMTLGVPLR